MASTASMLAVDRLVLAILDVDGVYFDDRCNMNTTRVIETIRQRKQDHKAVRFGFIAGNTYNSPKTTAGKVLNDKIKAIIAAGQCDQLIHYCYDEEM